MSDSEQPETGRSRREESAAQAVAYDAAPELIE
jgi:hypothetical protein